MLPNEICHPMAFFLSFLIFTFANIFSPSLMFTSVLSIILWILIIKTEFQLKNYLYFIFFIFWAFFIFFFSPNLALKILNILLYFYFLLKKQTYLSLLYICDKINFIKKYNFSLTRKLYVLSIIPDYMENIIKIYRKRTNKKIINPFYYYKYLINKINYEFCQNKMSDRSHEMYLQKIKQENLYRFSAFDIIFLLFHGIIVLIMIGGIL